MATRGVLEELASQYQRASGEPVATEAAGGVDVARRVREGEPFDVVVLASDVIDGLIDEGRLLRGSRADVVASSVAVAVRAGAPRPDISTEEAVRQAVLQARSLSYSTGPSGTYLEKTFDRWGILAEIKNRIVVPPPGTPVASMVAEGTADLGFQQLSELKDRRGIDVIGPLPPRIQCVTIFSGGITSSCERPDAARALLRYMASPEVAEIKRRYGLEPA